MANHLHTGTERSLEQKYSPRVPAASTPRSARLRDTLELLLSAAYLLWIEFVLKDWLISYYQPYYPYVASLATILGIIAGFIALQFVHNPRIWRDVVLAGCTILTVANIAELLPKKLGVLPAAAVLTCGLATPSLLIAKASVSMTRRYFYLAAMTIGLVALICQPANEPEKMFWGVIIALVTLIAGAAAVFIYRRREDVGWEPSMSPSFHLKAGSILLVAGILVLFSLTMVPLLSLSFTDTSLLGLGIGWGSQTILQSSDLIPAVPKQFHVVPALVLTISSLALLPLLIRKVNISGWRFALYAAAAVIALTASTYYFASALSMGSLLLAVLKSAHVTSPENNWFALTLAKEQGLLAIFILACILIISLAVSTLALAASGKGQEQEARVSLCAGGISSLYGILLGAHVGPPFLTGNSVAGTWALAVAFVSLAIASSRPQRRTNTRFAFVDATVKKRTKRVGWLVGSGVAALVIGLGIVLYQHALSKVIQPFVGTSPPPGYQNYVPLSSISREMQDATIAFEDPDFFDHHGLDWRSIHYSLRVDLQSGQAVSGGSTITQQLAKNLFLTKERTLWRKVKEAALALEMERLLPKQRLLELYLNTIDYGMGQHGVDAAANYYFHKQPRQLTLAESAMLVGLIPHPPDQRLSRYQLLTGQRTALQRIRNRWPDRYSEADIVSAAQIPLDDLIQPGESIAAHETTEPLPIKEQNGARRYWRRIGLSIGLVVFLGVGITSASAWRVVKPPNGEPFRQDPRLSRKNIFLFCVAFFGAFSIAAIHWHKVNSERAEYTIIYPYTASPNRDDRPSDVGINCVVLHATAETMEGSRRWFLDPTSKVSAHFIVSKEGEIFQSVPIEQRAWHAGVSELDGVPDVNNYSVGIEIVNRDDGTDPYTDVQYEAVARIISQLRSRYPIPDKRIVSHAQIAPGRKFDPVGFDFDKLRTTLALFR